MKFASVLAIRRSIGAVNRPKKTGWSGCGPIPAASTNEAVWSYLRPSIPCATGMKNWHDAMHTSMMFPTYPFLPNPTPTGIPITDGWSGSRVGGHCRS